MLKERNPDVGLINGIPERTMSGGGNLTIDGQNKATIHAPADLNESKDLEVLCIDSVDTPVIKNDEEA